MRNVVYAAAVVAKQITLIGVGLLGGSLGLAIRKAGFARKVVAYVRRSASMDECNQYRVADQATQDLKTAVHESDFVILCTPIGQMRALAEQMVSALQPGTVITDVGSVKSTVVDQLEPIFAQAKCRFVGSHPMAGGEKMGMAHARTDLFENAICVLTPTPNTDQAALNQVKALWSAVDAKTIVMSPDEHDELVSRSSHLPHIVAAELARYVLSPAHQKEQQSVCGPGFVSTTRIASSSPELWRDICLANQAHVSRVLGVFIESLGEFKHSLEEGDAAAVEEFFRQAKERRDQWIRPVDPECGGT